MTKKLRNDFAGKSSGNRYYHTRCEAILVFNSVLEDYGYHLDFEQLVDYNGNTGKAQHDVLDADGKIAGCAVFSWHRMESGNYEFIGYLA